VSRRARVSIMVTEHDRWTADVHEDGQGRLIIRIDLGEHGDDYTLFGHSEGLRRLADAIDLAVTDANRRAALKQAERVVAATGGAP